jgi:hypothetical protein
VVLAEQLRGMAAVVVVERAVQTVTAGLVGLAEHQ